MNDFSKEELEFFLDGIRHWNKMNSDTTWTIDLKKKIQSMIDNYQESCDQSWPSNMIKPCPKCKRHHDE